MKKFMQRSFIQKLIISIVCCMIMMNFCITSTAAASFGGKLMGYIIDFAGAIADVVGSLVQFGVTGHLDSATDDSEGWVVVGGKPYFPDFAGYGVIDYPILQVSPEVIFANGVQMLDANFISPIQDKNYRVPLDDESMLKSFKTLRDIIAGWYVTLRTIAIVGLLSVLIYIGIRIIISSTGQDKAKYKQRLVDWLVAFCLLFLMHYIMAALVTVVEKVNNVLGDSSGAYNGVSINQDYAKSISYNRLNNQNQTESVHADYDNVLTDVLNYFKGEYGQYEYHNVGLGTAGNSAISIHCSPSDGWEEIGTNKFRCYFYIGSYEDSSNMLCNITRYRGTSRFK